MCKPVGDNKSRKEGWLYPKIDCHLKNFSQNLSLFKISFQLWRNTHTHTHTHTHTFQHFKSNYFPKIWISKYYSISNNVMQYIQWSLCHIPNLSHSGTHKPSKKTLVALKLSLNVIQPRSKYFNERNDEKLYKNLRWYVQTVYLYTNTKFIHYISVVDSIFKV